MNNEHDTSQTLPNNGFIPPAVYRNIRELQDQRHEHLYQQYHRRKTKWYWRLWFKLTRTPEPVSLDQLNRLAERLSAEWENDVRSGQIETVDGGDALIELDRLITENKESGK